MNRSADTSVTEKVKVKKNDMNCAYEAVDDTSIRFAFRSLDLIVKSLVISHLISCFFLALIASAH